MDTQYPDQVFGPEMAIHGVTKAATGGVTIVISQISLDHILNIIRNSDRQGRLTPLGFVRGFQPWQGR